MTSRQPLAQLQPGAAAIAPVAAGSVDDSSKDADILTPSVRRLLAEQGVDPALIVGTGKGRRISREDVNRHLVQQAASAPIPVATTLAPPSVSAPVTADVQTGMREEKRVPMTRLRQRVAERLLDAKNTTAMLTTFNEVNMKPIMDIRKGYQERFEKRHDIKLGFMSFYVRAVTEALKRYPIVNTSIDGNDIRVPQLFRYQHCCFHRAWIGDSGFA